MSGEEGFEFIEVHGSIEADGIPGLVQKLSKAVHDVLDTDVVILVFDSEYGIGACGVAINRDNNPSVVARLRETADILERTHAAQAN